MSDSSSLVSALENVASLLRTVWTDSGNGRIEILLARRGGRRSSANEASGQVRLLVGPLPQDQDRVRLTIPNIGSQ